MKPQRILAAAALGIAALVPVAAAAAPAKTLPLRDFFRNPEQTGHQISPDGRYISWLAPWEKRMNVFVRPYGGGEAKRVTAETARDLAGYGWKGDRIVYAKDFGGDENFHIVSVGLDGGDLKDLTPGEKVKANVVDILEDDPDHLIVSHNRRDARAFDVYRVNVRTGTETMIAQNPGNIVGWMTDHAGRLRVATATDGVNTSLLYREKESDPFKPIVTTNFRESVAPMLFTFDDKRLYVASNRGRDKAALFEFDPVTAKEGRLIAENDGYDVGRLNHSRKRKVLTGYSVTTWKTERFFLDKEAEAMYRDLEKKLPGYEIALASANKAEDKYVVATYSDRTRGKRYLYDKATGKLDFLADVSPWLPEGELAEMKPVTYTSRDGLTIHGYLTLPKGVAPKNLPVVVNPHGGPWARDNWGFNPEVQFLANRGYAVFQMNFRGSTGYGRKFWEASFKQWGRTMQDDITDGVEWLKKEGIADPKRVAIYGASYGGYATLAGLAYTPDLYAAGVDYVGVSNLLTFMKAIPPYWKPMLDMLQEMVGYMDKDEALLKAASPVFHADRIKAPLLIAQGAKDPRVVKSESDQMVEAMRKRGVEVEYLVKENEGHGFRNEENRFEFYEAMERFLGKHLKR
ncbi:MAG TPA: S9 family peptidase [Usitatibacteraceae bacterium]|jgi:dipeptidyl aminopeptidase/acylaminoacyl peptidase|nr:S9 family peptidase [Usitatibacteraceae bacterium]